MKIVPCSSSAWLPIADARALPPNFTSIDKLPERMTSIPLGVAGPVSQWNTDFLFDYRVFPSAIIQFEPEWRQAGRAMAAGDIIVQRAVFPPFGRGLCLQFAVRVTRLIDERHRLGFVYETLAGHAESGVSEFFFEERSNGLHFTIHTFSRPAHWSSRLVRHVFTEPYQAWCTKRALENVRRTFLEANAKPSSDQAR
jgi:uncharacterized protein (UPF0548 family)